LVATALVHEVYLRLVGQKANYQNRSQFFGVAASMMRRVLVDHARARAAAKRPRPELRISLDGAMPSVAPAAFELLSLDRALAELAALDRARHGSSSCATSAASPPRRRPRSWASHCPRSSASGTSPGRGCTAT